MSRKLHFRLWKTEHVPHDYILKELVDFYNVNNKEVYTDILNGHFHQRN
jgi:hypothetical protein